jgi:hypothetical protein
MDLKRIVYTFIAFVFVFCSTVPLQFGKTAYAASGPISLGFHPFDTAVDPDQPVVYMTKQGSKTIYSVNYDTGTIKTLALPYPAERLELYNHNLYVTQLKMSHSSYNQGPYSGGIAEVDTQSFTLKGVMNVNADPYDIAIDRNGFIYITPGSGQFEDMKVYSLLDKTEVTNNRSMRQLSTIYYDDETSKVYTIDSDSSPRDVEAFEIDNGVIKANYDSPYHGDYDLDTSARITPDGLSMYNNSGVVFDLSSIRSGDMEYKFEFDEDYNDFAFSLNDQLTFAANSFGGIDVYRYNTTDYLYTIKEDVLAEKLLFQNGLISIYSDAKGNYFLEFINNYGPQPLANVEGLFIGYDQENEMLMDKFVNGVKDVPTNSVFLFFFNQNITLNNNAKITLTGPEGSYKLTCETENGALYIEPEYLLENTDYTLAIEEGAFTGYLGEKISGGITIHFKTMTPPITNLSVTINSNQAPLEYIFTANATGGIDPQYKFLLNENGVWKVLQDYSSSRKLIWNPKKNGSYTFRVMTRSNGSNLEYEKYYDVTQTVSDTIVPSATLVPSTIAPTNEDITIQVMATDNVGIKGITLPNGQVVNSSSTVYSVSENGSYYFEIEDLFGNVVTESLRVMNIDKVKPEITLLPSTTAPTKNDILIVANASDDVRVKGIKLPNGTFVNGTSVYYPISKNGTYQFAVEDTAGNITTESINIANIDKEPPAIPTVNPIWDSHTVITGKTEPNGMVYAKNGSTVIGSVKALADGQFKMTITKQKAGSKISIYVKDSNGNVSQNKYVTVMDKTPPALPTVNPIWDIHSVIFGKTEPNVTVYAKNGSTVIGSVKSSANGQFKMTIKKQKAGSKISIFVKDFGGNVSQNKSVTVLDKTPPRVPTVNKVTSSTKVVKGTAEKGTVVYIYSGKKYLNKGTVDSKGNFQINISKQKKNTKLQIYSIDKAKNKSRILTVTVN